MKAGINEQLKTILESKLDLICGRKDLQVFSKFSYHNTLNPELKYLNLKYNADKKVIQNETLCCYATLNKTVNVHVNINTNNLKTIDKSTNLAYEQLLPKVILSEMSNILLDILIKQTKNAGIKNGINLIKSFTPWYKRLFKNNNTINIHCVEDLLKITMLAKSIIFKADRNNGYSFIAIGNRELFQKIVTFTKAEDITKKESNISYAIAKVGTTTILYSKFLELDDLIVGPFNIDLLHNGMNVLIYDNIDVKSCNTIEQKYSQNTNTTVSIQYKDLFIPETIKNKSYFYFKIKNKIGGNIRYIEQ